MRLKSYFASTVEAAMALASKELGDDAMLVYSREASAETRYLGRYEVVFALEGDTAEPTPPPMPAAESLSVPPPTAATPPPARAADTPQMAELTREIAALRGEVHHLRNEIRRTPTAHPASSEPEQVLPILRRAGIEPQEAASLGVAVTSPGELARALAARIRTDPRLGREAGGSPVVVVAGFHGSGKTSAVVKMAAHYAATQRRLPHLVSFDSGRVGAAAQLRSMAALIGVTFQTASGVEALAAILRERQTQDLTLVDTAGYSTVSPEVAAEITALTAEFPWIELHLTLSAAMKAADQWRAVQVFESASPARLILTRLDETGTLGTAWSLAARANIPVSFLSTGPRLPEDWMPAEAHRFAEMVLGGSGEESAVVEQAPANRAVETTGETGSAPATDAPTEAQRKAEWLAGALRRMRKPVWAKAGVAG